eukprot:CAMPEP_0115572646 /NCGR_PEP_ID=MMETSP0272-20121206/584_1 /TAXON_ID=71861 /ORGANISM="Scrippsiella trochoidea, Strain CCMP3099" /LENGTH=34 /DNA_ID= /DNA_START= /DNA_END= /DNA_ORIENTATION=
MIPPHHGQIMINWSDNFQIMFSGMTHTAADFTTF